jgi:hypothetical protein
MTFLVNVSKITKKLIMLPSGVQYFVFPYRKLAKLELQLPRMWQPDEILHRASLQLSIECAASKEKVTVFLCTVSRNPHEGYFSLP